MKKNIFKLIFGGSLLYGFVAGILYFLQERFIFFPIKIPDHHKYSFADPYEEKNLKLRFGIVINTLHFKTVLPRKGVIFYLHGNSGSIEDLEPVPNPLLKMGYDVFLLDYRGYGKSKGTFSKELDFHDDVRQVYNYLLQMYEGNEIVIYGRSLGTGIATKLATYNQPQKVILESPYFSMDEMASRSIKIFPVSRLLKYHFRTDENLQKVKAPLYIIHGTDDELIPFEHALRLTRLLQKPDHLITIEGGGHNNLADFPKFHESLERILTQQKSVRLDSISDDTVLSN